MLKQVWTRCGLNDCLTTADVDSGIKKKKTTTCFSSFLRRNIYCFDKLALMDGHICMFRRLKKQQQQNPPKNKQTTTTTTTTTTKCPLKKRCPGGRRASGVGHRASSHVYLLVNLFSKLYVTFILQWITFIFGRDEERTSGHVTCKRDNSHFLHYVLISPDVRGLPFG